MRKMKCTGICVLALIMLFVTKLSCFSQEEMPITSKSKEAVRLYKEARNMSENFLFDQSLKKYDEALKLDPDFAVAYLSKSVYVADYKSRMSNLHEAKKRMDNISEGERYFILIHEAWYNSEEDKMWNNLDKLIAMYPNDKYLNNLAGELNYIWQNYDKALGYFKKSVDIDNDYAAAINMLGYSYRALEDYKQAEKYFKRYITLLPNNAAPYDSYADFLLAMEKYDEAIQYYQKAVEMNDGYYYSLRRIGNIYILKEEYDKARDFFVQFQNKATNLGSQMAALQDIAITYLYEENKEKAIKTFDQYTELAQRNNNSYYEVTALANKGLIYSCCDDPKKGLDYYNKALQILENSDLTEVQKNELRINNAMLKLHAYIELEAFDKCAEELERCRKLTAELNNTFVDNWIKILTAYNDLRQDNIDQAIEKLENINVNYIMKLYYLALAYEMDGNFEKANKYYAEMLNTKESGLNLALYYKRVKDKVKD
ncbi:MAG: tetratricopeptide repeat protein [Bacteroidetes bacterium]|nr:tetratricopeptide repeat protein [Bacteroidota bacterium]